MGNAAGSFEAVNKNSETMLRERQDENIFAEEERTIYIRYYRNVLGDPFIDSQLVIQSYLLWRSG